MSYDNTPELEAIAAIKAARDALLEADASVSLLRIVDELLEFAEEELTPQEQDELDLENDDYE